MCGSGTLPIEAALIAADIAPGLLRPRFGFERWKQHDAGAWRALARPRPKRAAARGSLDAGRIRGYDRDPRSCCAMRGPTPRAPDSANASGSERCELAKLPAAPAQTGLVAVNPPYGERLGEAEELRGALRAARRAPARAAIAAGRLPCFTGNPAARPRARDQRAAHAPHDERADRVPAAAASSIEPSQFVQQREPGRPPVIDADAARARPGAPMFANRLRKNLDQLAAWARARGDLLLPRLRRRHAGVRVRDRPVPVATRRAAAAAGCTCRNTRRRRRSTATRRAGAARGGVLGAAGGDRARRADAIYWRTRRQQKGSAQYEAARRARRARRRGARAACKFLVNFTDYLDTGLFLDHRPTRARIRERRRASGS